MQWQLVRRSRSFRPQVETLENRWCPSVSVSVFSHTLVVQGDSADNAVTITDDGSGGVSATITGANGATATRSGTAITNVLVSTRGGSDSVAFALTGPLTSRLNLGIDLGYFQDSSSTTNSVTLDFNQGVSSPYLTIGVLGTRGTDNVTATFGSVSDSYVYFGASLDGGDDTFAASVTGDIHDSGVVIAAFSGSGTDSLGVDVAGAVDAGAYLGVLLDGGSGDDAIDFDYTGQMNGKLAVALVGGYGTDTVTGNITLHSGSTGKVAAAVFGGGGDDTLTLNVNDNSGGTLGSVYALLDGGPGTDTCTATKNVTVINCEL
jgi:hypothetical protein